MKKVIVYFVIWLISAGIFLIVNKDLKLLQAILVMVIPCMTYWLLYFVCSHNNGKRNDAFICKSGVLGGRGLGLFINMFLIEIFFELHCNVEVAFFLLGIGIVLITINRKMIKRFFTKNVWENRYCWIYLGVELVITSLYAIIGNQLNATLIELNNNGMNAKIIIGVIICLAFYLTEPPNSFFIRISSRNDQCKDEKMR